MGIFGNQFVVAFRSAFQLNARQIKTLALLFHLNLCPSFCLQISSSLRFCFLLPLSSPLSFARFPLTRFHLFISHSRPLLTPVTRYLSEIEYSTKKSCGKIIKQLARYYIIGSIPVALLFWSIGIRSNSFKFT